MRQGVVDAKVFSKTQKSLKMIEKTLKNNRDDCRSFVFIVDKGMDET